LSNGGGNDEREWRPDAIDLADIAHAYSSLARGIGALCALSPVPEQTPDPDFLWQLGQAAELHTAASRIFERILTAYGLEKGNPHVVISSQDVHDP